MKIALIGPGMIVMVVLYVLAAVAAAFLILDASRRTALDFTGVWEGRWAYIVPQAFYFVVYVMAQVPFLTKLAPWSVAYALLGPLAVAQQFAYLLRVVFPTHGRLETRLEARYAGMAPGDIANADDETTIARSATNA
ncbi:MAG TPA: hypothetical protein VIL06_06230 [Coriobacteriia bacterium]